MRTVRAPGSPIGFGASEQEICSASDQSSALLALIRRLKIGHPYTASRRNTVRRLGHPIGQICKQRQHVPQVATRTNDHVARVNLLASFLLVFDSDAETGITSLVLGVGAFSSSWTHEPQ